VLAEPRVSVVYYGGYLFMWPYNEDFDWCYWDSTASDFQCNPHSRVIRSDDLAPAGFPGGSLTLTLNKNCTSNPSCLTGPPGQPSTGVLWAIAMPSGAPSCTDPATDTGAFQAEITAYGLNEAPPISGQNPNFDVTTLWTSTESILGSIFALPTIANGYLYAPIYGTNTANSYGSSVLIYYPTQ